MTFITSRRPPYAIITNNNTPLSRYLARKELTADLQPKPKTTPEQARSKYLATKGLSRGCSSCGGGRRR